MDSMAEITMHSLRISSDDRPRSRSVFSCILATTRSWFSDPPLTPIRTGLPWSMATLQIVAKRSSRRAPVPTLPGIDPVLVERGRALRVAGQEQVTVVVEVADQRRLAAGVQHPPLDLGDCSGGLGHVDGDSHELGPRFGELDALAGRCFGIGRIRHRHRLDRNGRASADLQVSDAHADGAMQPHGFHVP